MVSPREWIDVQATDVEGRALSWVRRYRPAAPELVEAAGFPELVVDRAPGLEARAAAATPDVDDVIEASQTIDPEAVRSWVAEMNDPFDLDGRRLIRLADAGVPESVIDVMVAVSYPEDFALSRDGGVEEVDDERYGYGPGYGRRVFLGSSIWLRDPFYWSPFGYGYYGYGFGPYGYWPYGGGYYQPGVVIVAPREEQPSARVVRGRGYTRGGGASSSGSAGTGRSDPPARRSEQPGGGGSSGGSSAGGGSSKSSGGSGGSSEGRQAKPR
jgi:hypothetical protein